MTHQPTHDSSWIPRDVVMFAIFNQQCWCQSDDHWFLAPLITGSLEKFNPSLSTQVIQDDLLTMSPFENLRAPNTNRVSMLLTLYNWLTALLMSWHPHEFAFFYHCVFFIYHFLSKVCFAKILNEFLNFFFCRIEWSVAWFRIEISTSYCHSLIQSLVTYQSSAPMQHSLFPLSSTVFRIIEMFCQQKKDFFVVDILMSVNQFLDVVLILILKRFLDLVLTWTWWIHLQHRPAQILSACHST